ncbi:MAG: hypothetical protein VKP70_07835 [Cyanobacteriota bacterium]|nr:hypothetical protein [Cyanobacteriota bacterium]
MLTPEDLARLEGTVLPALERHYLLLLAHGLRTFQAIAAASATPHRCPDRPQIAAWIAQQAPLTEDPAFQEAFLEQLSRLVDPLEAIAMREGQAPLALDIDQLVAWVTEQADSRLNHVPAGLLQEGESPPPG